jgi:hypothetical protein
MATDGEGGHERKGEQKWMRQVKVKIVGSEGTRWWWKVVKASI